MNTQTSGTETQDWRKQYHEIEQSVTDALAAAGVTYSAMLAQGNAVDMSGEKPWPHDLWRITFSRAGKFYGLDFKTGTGLRKQKNKHIAPQPVAPVAAYVLHSVCMDDTQGEDFESWAQNYGYSADSISALDTYRACQKQTKAAREFFGRELLAKLAELVQEY